MKDANEQIVGLTLSINTTEDCNLACKYCYEINKKRKTMSVDTVEKFFRVILSEEDPICIKDDNSIMTAKQWYKLAIIDLIGGDALMRPDLCDQILTTWQNVIWELDTPLTKNFRKRWLCTISTNGTLFSNPKVRSFCEKWRNNLSIGVSIDGCPQLHDLNRPFVDGRPSMPVILENWKWYQKLFPYHSKITKATLAKNSIPYIFDSLKYMYEVLGITDIHQNFIMEYQDYTEEDYKELIHQLQLCIDWILETPGLDQKIYWSMISQNMAVTRKVSDEEWFHKGWCGSGHMPALSIDGNIYPCFRWLPHTQSGAGVMACGNVNDGLIHKDNFKKVTQGGFRCNCTKEEKCKECIYLENCAYCIGGCYYEFGEFRRTTYTCTIVKIQCEMAKRYWNRYNKKHNIKERYEEYELPV